jgi:hypothetical protein
MTILIGTARNVSTNGAKLRFNLNARDCDYCKYMGAVKELIL